MRRDEHAELVELVKRYRDQSHTWYLCFTALADQLRLTREDRKQMFDAMLYDVVSNTNAD